MKVKRVCGDCGKEPKPNKEKSNENWTVIDNKSCEDCGGELKFDFD